MPEDLPTPTKSLRQLEKENKQIIRKNNYDNWIYNIN
jgi:hypothetical protein